MFKKLLFLCWFVLPAHMAFSQCSMCTKTAASLDDKAARGLNSGIIYLAFLPLVMIGFVGVKWYRQHKDA
jgi:hypothetical protein